MVKMNTTLYRYEKRILDKRKDALAERNTDFCADRSFEKYCPQQKHINYNNIAIKINTAADKRNYIVDFGLEHRLMEKRSSQLLLHM